MTAEPRFPNGGAHNQHRSHPRILAVIVALWIIFSDLQHIDPDRIIHTTKLPTGSPSRPPLLTKSRPTYPPRPASLQPRLPNLSNIALYPVKASRKPPPRYCGGVVAKHLTRSGKVLRTPGEGSCWRRVERGWQDTGTHRSAEAGQPFGSLVSCPLMA